MHALNRSMVAYRVRAGDRKPAAQADRIARAEARVATPAAMTAAAAQFVAAFAPIGLATLNAKAAMLERQDNKYVVRAATLRAAAPKLARHFDVLEIDGARAFGYETCYFDDPERSNYFDQLHELPQRFKVRTRRYLDAGSCYAEFKFKGADHRTVKQRIAYPPAHQRRLDADAWKHIRDSWRELSGNEFDRELEFALSVRYQRITLVAHEGGERTTIDRALVFADATRERALADDLYIIETKSDAGDGIADRVLRELGCDALESCSKYCLALAALNQVHEYGRFLPAMRALGVLATADDAP